MLTDAGADPNSWANRHSHAYTRWSYGHAHSNADRRHGNSHPHRRIADADPHRRPDFDSDNRDAGSNRNAITGSYIDGRSVAVADSNRHTGHAT